MQTHYGLGNKIVSPLFSTFQRGKITLKDSRYSEIEKWYIVLYSEWVSGLHEAGHHCIC